MNLWDGVILLLVLGIAVLAFRRMKKDRKQGGCGCGCEGCARSCKKPGSVS